MSYQAFLFDSEAQEGGLEELWAQDTEDAWWVLAHRYGFNIFGPNGELELNNPPWFRCEPHKPKEWKLQQLECFKMECPGDIDWTTKEHATMILFESL